MEQKIYDYRATEEIKQIVIGIQQLRCRRGVERQVYRGKTASAVDFLKMTKEYAKRELLDKIGDFILVKEIQDGFYVEAELFLPYVRDDVVSGLERINKSLSNTISQQDARIYSLREEVKLLSRPWWKKLFGITK